MKRYFCLLMGFVMFLTTGCSAAFERQTDRMMDDSTITTRINNTMIKDDVVKARHIDVDTVDGHVTLTGVVKTHNESQRAVQLATRQAGVKSVRNNLQIGEKSWGEAFNDKWLGSRIKSKLIAEPEIRSLNIDVDVHKGIVTLTGIVGDPYQKKRAIELARATDGTRKVVDNLNVK